MDIEVTCDLSISSIGFTRAVGALPFTTTGEHWDFRKLNIGTGEETITISTDVTGGSGAGYALFYNADDTNFVKIGRVTTSYFMRLAAGQIALLPLESTLTQLFMIADTAACDVEMYILER